MCESKKVGNRLQGRMAAYGYRPARRRRAVRQGRGRSEHVLVLGTCCPVQGRAASRAGRGYVPARPTVYRRDLRGMPSLPSGPCQSQVPGGSTHPYGRYLLLYCDPVHRAIESPKVNENGGSGWHFAPSLLPSAHRLLFGALFPPAPFPPHRPYTYYLPISSPIPPIPSDRCCNNYKTTKPPTPH